MWVKICGITGAEIGAAAARAGADAVGLIMVPGLRRTVAPGAARLLVKQWPAALSTVGVIMDLPFETALALAADIGFSHLQLHGSEPPDYVARLPIPAVKTIKLAGPGDVALVDAYVGANPWGILIEPKVPDHVGGAGVTLPWALASRVRERLRRLGYRGRLILAGGLSPDRVAPAVQVAQPDGVDVSSGVETAGCKDISKIRRFIAGAKNLTGATPGMP